MQSSSQIITTNKPTPNFYRPDSLPVAKQTVSEHWRANREQNMHLLNSTSASIFPAGVLWQPIHYLQRDSEAGSVWKHPELWGWGTLTETWHLGCRWQTHALVELSQRPWTDTSNRQMTVMCTIDWRLWYVQQIWWLWYVQQTNDCDMYNRSDDCDVYNRQTTVIRTIDLTTVICTTDKRLWHVQ